jgi:uncharacterized membrane protein
MNAPELYLLHPVAVHFPIAALLLGLAAEAAGRWTRRWAWLPEAASALLWFGTLAVWVSLGLGLLAEETAPHVPSAWRTLNAHQRYAYWTAGVFSALSIARWLRWDRKSPALFLAAWLAGAGLLLATGYEGGELVFKHGMGVVTE